MALFQKKPQVSDSAPLYTLGLQRTVMVVGLGNPGKEYNLTRHNAGFLAVDEFAHKNEASWLTKKDLKAQITQITIAEKRVIIVKPQTFMNNSGDAVQAVQHFYKISTPDILVVHDELDMLWGQLRSRMGGGSAGHNGLKSIIQQIGEDFGRVRIGIRNEHAGEGDSADFVLSQFSKAEQAQLPAMTREVVSVITEYIASGALPHDTRSF